jgi:hypothetical protein
MHVVAAAAAADALVSSERAEGRKLFGERSCLLVIAKIASCEASTAENYLIKFRIIWDCLCEFSPIYFYRRTFCLALSKYQHEQATSTVAHDLARARWMARERE